VFCHQRVARPKFTEFCPLLPSFLKQRYDVGVSSPVVPRQAPPFRPQLQDKFPIEYAARKQEVEDAERRTPVIAQFAMNATAAGDEAGPRVPAPHARIHHDRDPAAIIRSRLFVPSGFPTRFPHLCKVVQAKRSWRIIGPVQSLSKLLSPSLWSSRFLGPLGFTAACQDLCCLFCPV
jgi:hypothetical protein